MNSAQSVYARLPTFTAVIDSLASGLGIKRNKEDSLASLASFGGRIDAYSGSSHRAGLQDRLLDVLAGSNKALRSLVQAKLLDVETTLADARALPLLTEATEIEGLRRFIETCAVPWIVQMLADACQYHGSVLDSTRLLLEAHAASHRENATSYLATWKTAVRREIPEGVTAREFRSTLARLDRRSQRKNSSIEKDLANLRVEIQSGLSPQQELDSVVDAVGRLYIAGMATMRMCAMAAKIIPEQDLLEMVTSKLQAGMGNNADFPVVAPRHFLRMYWDCLDPGLTLSKKFDQLCAQLRHLDEANYNELRADSCALASSGLLMFVFDYAEGCWHLRHGRNDLAEVCLQRVVNGANGRQLGETAAFAASLLIALRLGGYGPFTFEALNPLMRVRIDNMQQSIEIHIDTTPTPFSDWSSHTKPSFYDSHMMKCVAFFNDVIHASGVPAICNPLQRFDASLKNLIAKSREAGAKLKEVERRRPAIVGTSIKPYYVLRAHLYYRSLLGWNQPNLPGMDAYAMLPPPDQLRLLRFVDPKQFQFDLQAHGLDSWSHPDDVS